MEAEAGAGRAKAMAEARGGDGRPEEGPGGEEMGLQLKVEPEGGALEVKLELAGGVEAKLEWEGLRIKVEVVEEPPEGGEGRPEALQLKQEVMEEVEVKQEVVEVKQEVQVKQEVLDEVEVKQEVIEQVEVKQEPLDEVEVKQEPLDEVEVKQEPLDPGQIKEEPLDEVEVKQEAIEGVEIKEEPVDAADVKRECVHEAEVKQEGGAAEGGRAGPLDRKQALVAGLEALREVVGRMRAREELLHWAGLPVKKEEEEEEEEGLGAEEDTKVGVKLEVKEEEAAGEPEVKLEVKEEDDGMEVKVEAQGVEMKKEEVKEEAPQGPEVKEEQAQGPRRPGNAEPKEEPGEPPAGRKRKLAMSSCETCGTEEAKYRCPRCMKCSCSLACVKKHKTELTCNGIREKTAFVSLKQFTEINLLSDYRFLEDVGRSADYIARDIFLKRPSTNRILNYMKNRARRHNIDLRILPIGFTKRRENSTMFDRKEQRFYWHLKLLFPQSRAEYIEKGVPGDKKLHEILRTYIDPEKSDPVIRQRLKAYVLSESGIQILMKIENMQHNLVRYYELDPCKSLIDNLKNKVVIEYPTLHVVLKGSKNDMVILGQERNESMKSFGSENPAFCSEEEGEI